MSEIIKLTVIEKKDELETLLDQYDAKFEEPFPRFFAYRGDPDLIKEEIRECLKTGKEFDPYEGLDEDVEF